MNCQTFHLLRVLADRRVTRTPLRVLRELRQRGRPRLPVSVERSLAGGLRHSLGGVAFLRRWLAGERLSRHHGQWVINSFLPPFPGPAFDRMFENLLSGRRLSPVSAFLAVTAHCPCHCWHCSLRHRRSGELSAIQWLEIIRSLHQLGASLIGFTGGEPLSRPDLPDLVAAASRGGAATLVFTSGQGFGADQARALAEAGLWAFCVSLDAAEADAADRLRGLPGSFDQVLAALRLARQTGFYTMIGTVATRAAVDQRRFEAIYRLGRQLGIDELRLIEPMPCGQLTDPGHDTLLTPAHIRQLRQFHVQTNRRGHLPKVCAFNHIESPELFGCGAGTQHLFIDPAGEVCPCDFTPLSFGNATREPLALLWSRMNDALGNPRRHCFIQAHHALLAPHAAAGLPLPLELSRQVCAQAGFEPLPDYFAWVTQGGVSPPPSLTPL